LPPKHHFTKLIVSSGHIRLHHAGPQLLMASLREKYRIPRIWDVVKTVIHHCLTCYKFKVKASQQLMGQLPSTRVQPARPFTTTGIDYAGPIVLRLGSTRSKQTTKGYIAIFVCIVTKAVHIEVVTSLTIEAFLAALRHLSHVEEDWGSSIPTTELISRGHPTSCRRSTTCYNVQPRWRGSRISWQQKAATGSLSRHMDHTSEACGKQQLNTWNTTCDN